MERNETLDSIKGLAILLVVAGHCCLCQGITDFIYSFHMPVFFMIAGFLHKKESSDSIAGVFLFMIKRLKRLYISFAFWSVVLILAHNALVNVGIYNADSEFVEAIKGKPWEASTISSIRAGVGNLWSLAQIGSKTLLALLFLSNPGVEFDGTFWFLKVLFFCSVLYCGVDWMLKKCRIPTYAGQTGLILLLFVVCKYVSIPWSHAFLGGTPLEPYALYHIGAVLRRSVTGKRFDFGGTHPVIGFFVSLAAILAMNAFFPRNGYYCYAVHRIIVSLLGLYMLYLVAILFKRCVAGDMLSFLGRRTQPIMIFHFAAFRVVTLIGIVIGIENGGGLAAFPIGYEGGIFAVVYILAGIVCPLLVNEAYMQVKFAVIQKVKRA